MSKLFQTCFALAILSGGSIFASEFSEAESSTLLDQNVADKNEIAAKKNMSSSQGSTDKSKQCPGTDACKPLLPSLPCPDSYRVTGDFLYLLPTLDDTYFVIDSGTGTSYPSGKRLNNDFGFNPGFQVGLEGACCDHKRELQATYAYLNANQERNVGRSHLWATLGRPDVTSSFEDYTGTASSNLNLLYQNGNLDFSQQVLNTHGVYVYIQPGIEYAYLRLEEDYVYKNGAEIGTISQKSRTWGVGPQIGLTLDYNVYQGAFNCSNMQATQAFSITSAFSGSILMGRGMVKNFQTLTGTTELNITDEHTWRTVEAFHARFGVNYLVQGSSVGLSLGVGYEFNTYTRALSRVIFPDDLADGLCITNYYNFDLQGLYVSGALSF